MADETATRDDIAHLFGRAAFGATKADFDKWAGQPYATVVDTLFPPLPADKRVSPDDVGRIGFETDRTGTNAAALRPAQAWWMERLRSTLFPLEERTTLFWHDHFATAFNSPPNVDHIMIQISALRANAFGDLRALLNTMTVDAAMLYWLSGFVNRAGSINENYGREFFELFTLGTKPQYYTEDDIKEAARAFTGWTVNTTAAAGQYTKNANGTNNRHDKGTKTVLGRTFGNLEENEYKEVTEAALATDRVQYFIAYKMVRNFGYLPTVTDVTAGQDPVIDAVANALKPANTANPWDLKAAVRAMLVAPGWRFAYRDPTRLGTRQPVETVVHAAKILGVNLNQRNASNQLVTTFINASSRAGQVVLFPPNVGGWPVDRTWFAQTTNLARYEILNVVWNSWAGQNALLRVAPPPSNDLPAWLAFMGLSQISANTSAQVAAALADPRLTNTEIARQKALFLMLGTSPEWQVM